MRNLADRLDKIQAFQVMEVMEKARLLELQGRDVIHLEVGEPDFSTPRAVADAGIRAMSEGKTRYTTALGIPELRQSIAEFYQTKFGVTIDPSRVVITPGASGAISLLTALLFNPGDGVLLPDPGYPCNETALRLVGAMPQIVPVDASTGFQLSGDLLQQHWSPETKGAWLASPSNPTGTIIEPNEMALIKKGVDQQSGVLLVDEIYHCLSYEQQPHTVLSLDTPQENLFVINSFSKYFNMTGWRLGWLVAPGEAVSHLEKLAQNFYLSAPTVAQYAALEAFTESTLALCEKRREELDKRRRYLLSQLPKLGFAIPCAPQGAFYIYCDVSAITHDSFSFCYDLIDAVGVAVTPGIDFGQHQAHRFIRIAYTQELDRLGEAVERIEQFIKQK